MITTVLLAAMLQVPVPPAPPAPRPVPRPQADAPAARGAGQDAAQDAARQAPAAQSRAGHLAMQLDTTFAVPAAGRIQLEAMNGAVTVRVWDRQAVRVQSSQPRVTIRESGGVVRLDGSRLSRVEYEVTVPRAYGVRVEGMNMPVSVYDVSGAVRVSNVTGAVQARGTGGSLQIESVSGTISIENTRGDVTVNTVNEGIRLVNVRGNVTADAVNGSITMRGLEGMRVSASTINGEIDFAGGFQDGGRYYFGAHNGRITVAIPERTNAKLGVSTQSGSIDAGFPVPVSSVRDGRFAVTLGTGSATIEVESFNGSVRLVRPSR